MGAYTGADTGADERRNPSSTMLPQSCCLCRAAIVPVPVPVYPNPSDEALACVRVCVYVSLCRRAASPDA